MRHILVAFGLMATSAVQTPASAPAQGTAGSRQSQGVYRASLELLTIDVQVASTSGSLVWRVTPADFDVRVSGRKRQPTSATFLHHDEGTVARSSLPGADNPRSSECVFGFHRKAEQPTDHYLLTIDRDDDDRKQVSDVRVMVQHQALAVHWIVWRSPVRGVTQASDAAGEAAWKQIAASAAAEWEGDIAAKAEWTFKNYRSFLIDFPKHRRAGEAAFLSAEATWALGGYPEAFRYIMRPGTVEDLKNHKRYLDQWFDTRGFGGGAVDPPSPPDPKAAARARELFREVVSKYPKSSAAPTAAYYSAVILDYCLGQPARALPEYRAVVQRYPDLIPFADKARARIKALETVRR